MRQLFVSSCETEGETVLVCRRAGRWRSILTWVVVCVSLLDLCCFYFEWVPVFYAFDVTLQEVVREELHGWTAGGAAAVTVV